MSYHSHKELKEEIELYLTTLRVDVRHLHYALKELYRENHIPGKAPSVRWLLAVYNNNYIAGKRKRLREKCGKVAFQVKTLVGKYSFAKKVQDAGIANEEAGRKVSQR